MVSTRKVRSSAKRSYRKRVALSKCRLTKRATKARCNRRKGCSLAKGRKRTFCRKSKNAKRHHMKLRTRRGGGCGCAQAGGSSVGMSEMIALSPGAFNATPQKRALGAQ